jgi:hypothetical protein
MVLRLFNYTQTVTASTTGGISLVFNNNPGYSGQTSPDWGNVTSLFQEFRCLGMRLRWIPQYTTYATGNTPLLASQLVLAGTRDLSAAAPTVATGAYQVQPFKSGPIMKELQLEMRMDDAFAAGFVNTTSFTAASFGIYIVSSGLSNNGIYAQVLVEWLVQLRNPR